MEALGTDRDRNTPAAASACIRHLEAVAEDSYSEAVVDHLSGLDNLQ